MKILYRLIIVLGFAVVGLVIGTFGAAELGVAEGSGLAGVVIVLGYGVIVAVIASVLGLVVGLKLSGSTLARVAVALGILILVFAALTVLGVRGINTANLDPPEAYEGIPMFSITLERTDRADPVLGKRVSIDSDQRIWTSQLPDNRTCSSQAPADSLRGAADALQDFLKATGGKVACSGKAEEIITWRLDTATGPNEGSIRLDAACRASEPQAMFLLFALQQVTVTGNSQVKCD